MLDKNILQQDTVFPIFHNDLLLKISLRLIFTMLTNSLWSENATKVKLNSFLNEDIKKIFQYAIDYLPNFD